MGSYDPVITIVNKLAAAGKMPRRVGSEFKALCPSHDDSSPSLQVGRGKEDKGAVVYCHAGCTPEMVLGAIGMTMQEAFDDYGELTRQQPTGLPTRAAAPGALATYFYEDELGHVLYRVERRANKTFTQARPDPAAPGEWIYSLGDVRRVPFHLPALRRAIQDQEPVYLVEGEKDVQTLESQGFVATCNPGGAGKWKRDYNALCTGGHFVLLPDNDPAGHDHAQQVLGALSTEARTIKLVELPDLPPKGDVTDWFEAGGTADKLRDLVAEATVLYTNQPKVFTAYELMKQEFTPIVMAVPGFIAEGLTFFVGAPKIGKSWWTLNIAIAIARGEMAMGSIPCEQGDVLMLALEDTPRRLQRRMVVCIGQQDGPEKLHFATTWPRMDAGGLDQLEEWLRDTPGRRCVFIDTLAKFKASDSGQGGQNSYGADYACVAALKSLADEYACPIVLVHHTRKAADGDALNTVAGSVGLTGAADATCILKRPRGENKGTLFITGRDVEEGTSALEFDPDTGSWLYLGDAEDMEEANTEKEIIDYLDTLTDSNPPETCSPKDIAEKFDLKEGTAKWMLSKMCQEGKIIRIGRGKYTTENHPNASAAIPPPPVPASGMGVAGTPGANVALHQGGAVIPTTAQPPLPGTGGRTVPAGPLALGGSDEDEEYGEFEVPDTLDGLIAGEEE